MQAEHHSGSRTVENLSSPFLEVSRVEWSQLAGAMESPLSAAEVEHIRGLGENLDIREVEEVYLPLSRLLSLYVESRHRLQAEASNFLGKPPHRPTPFVIGVAGSVAAGKSTAARLLRDLLSRWEATPNVALVTTDGFLFSNAELERRGIFDLKGFPESYDRKALLRFVTQVKSGAENVRAPKYSHVIYDIVPDEFITVDRPDVLIIEGLNVLQPPSAPGGASVSDYFDFSIYIDARTSDIKKWYLDRFMKLKHDAFSDPDSYFRPLAAVSDAEALKMGEQFWDEINAPNLVVNILPTRSRANLVLRKRPDHRVHTVLMRKL